MLALVDVGGDVLGHGDEPGLASPLCDAVLLAASAHLDLHSADPPGPPHRRALAARRRQVLLRPAAALRSAARLAAAVLDAGSLEEAEERLAARGIRTELAYERDAAGN